MLNDLALLSFSYRCHSAFPLHWFIQDILTSGHHSKRLWGSIHTDNYTALYCTLDWPSFNSWKTAFSVSKPLPMLFLLLRILFINIPSLYLANFFSSWCLGWHFTSSPRPALNNPDPRLSIFIISFYSMLLHIVLKIYNYIFIYLMFVSSTKLYIFESKDHISFVL